MEGTVGLCCAMEHKLRAGHGTNKAARPPPAPGTDNREKRFNYQNVPPIQQASQIKIKYSGSLGPVQRRHQIQ